MNTEIQKTKHNIKKILIAALLTVILAGISASVYFCYNIFSYDRIYSGVYINSYHVGGLLPSEAAALLQKKFQDRASNTSVRLQCNKASTVINLKDLNIKYNIKAIVDQAYSIGRQGNLFERGYEIFLSVKNNSYLGMKATFDGSKLDQKINFLFDKIFVRVKEADLIFQDSKEKVYLRSGHHGVSFNKQAVRSKIVDSIVTLKGGVLNIEAIKTPPSKLDADNLLAKIVRDPANPAPVVKNNTITVTPALSGRSIEKKELAQVIDGLSGKEDTVRLLPVKFTKPALETKDITDKLLKDTLGSYVTTFHSYNYIERNRTQNIKLAAAKINNYILGPGQTFSFNNIVGERTAAAGYKDAYIFENGQVVSGLGGGICQVSSTLYNTVLYADLDILERTNHMFAISYVPLGIDAAVAYGSSDFRFRNNTGWPIKIECTITPDNKLMFKLIGTVVTTGKSVTITTKTVRTIPFSESKVYDSQLPYGSKTVIQGGSPGYVVDTYKTVKINGQLISEKKIHTSTYTPLNRQVKVGTKR